MPQLKLIETFSTGAKQVFPLHKLQNLKASAGAVYSVVDTETSEIPQGLRLKRKEDALEVEVDGEVVATLEGFYEENASSLFRIEGSGSATGAPAVIAATDAPPDENSNIVWEADASKGDWGNWGWYAGGGALVVGGLAAAGGGGGGSGGGDTGVDTTPPTIVSPFNAERVAVGIDEEISSGEVIYTIEVDEAATFSIVQGDDSPFVIEIIDDNNAQVILSDSADIDSQASYEFTLVAADAAGNVTQQVVTATVNDPDDTTPPEIISGGSAQPVSEIGGSGQIIYQATANEPATFSLAGTDAASFSINANTGVVTLTDTPDFDDQSSYEFTVVAEDAAGNVSEPQTVTLDVIDPEDDDITPPTITSGAMALPINENSEEGQVVYTADANEDAVFTLAGRDADSFSINGETGAVTLTESPDFERQQSYEFTVIATDEAGNPGEQTVTLAVNNLPPEITSPETATPIAEGNDPGTVVYTVMANEAATFSLEAGLDAASFSIDSETGNVTLLESADFESQSSYNFTVVATDNADANSEQTVSLAVDDVPEEEVDTSVVVFDLTSGLSSDHSAQSFDADVDYTIYIMVDSGDHNINLGAGEAWSDAGNLTAEDQVIFVGSGSDIVGDGGRVVTTLRTVTAIDRLALIAQEFGDGENPAITFSALDLTGSGSFRRIEGTSGVAPDTAGVDLWAGGADLLNGGTSPSFTQNYLQTLPSGITLPV